MAKEYCLSGRAVPRGGRESESLLIGTVVIVYHVTGVEVAELIDRDGFRDNTAPFLTNQEFSGVWVSDVPLDQGGFDNSIVFEIDVADLDLSEMEWIEEGKGY